MQAFKIVELFCNIKNGLIKHLIGWYQYGILKHLLVLYRLYFQWVVMIRGYAGVIH